MARTLKTIVMMKKNEYDDEDSEEDEDDDDTSEDSDDEDSSDEAEDLNNKLKAHKIIKS